MADKEAVAEVLNPAEDVRNDVAAAIAQLKGDEPEVAEAGEPTEEANAAPEPAAEVTDAAPKADHPTDKNRYSDGTFKTTKTEAAPPKAAPVETKSPPAVTAKASTEQPSTAASAPPVSWAAEAKASWASLSPAIQTAVIKREAEVSSGFKQKTDEVRRYEAMIAPIAEASRTRGIPAEQGLQMLIAAQKALDTNPAQAIAHIAASYGIDLAALAQNPPAPQSQRVEPAVPPQFVEKVSSLESRLNNFLTNQTVGVIDSFAKSPGHEHYEAVEGDLLRIIPMIQQAEPGLPHQEVLQKAYDQAIWLNPDVREKMLAEQRAQADTQRTQAITTKAASAKKAAVSIKGSSNGAMPPPKQANGTGDVYDDVRAAINQLRQ